MSVELLDCKCQEKNLLILNLKKISFLYKRTCHCQKKCQLGKFIGLEISGSVVGKMILIGTFGFLSMD